MEIINKLSMKEKNLFFVLLTLLILFGSYQWGFQRFIDKTDVLYEENTTLQVKLEDLQQKAANRDKYMNETEYMNEETDMMLSYFPVTLTQEKNTIFVTNLERYADMKVSSISFVENTEIYSTEQVSEDVTGDTEDANEMVEEVIQDDITSSGDITVDGMSISGYKTTLILTYKTNYGGLKRAIEYINSYNERMNIVDLSAAFDNSTGNLTGTITFDIYAIGGIDKTDDILDIPGVDIGTQNIFGTFELNVTDTTY